MGCTPRTRPQNRQSNPLRHFMMKTEISLYQETNRPQIHFTPEKNWMNDPNGPVYFEGEYHIFYQHNPFGDKWGHISWGHAVSTDLLHWEHLPVAIPEDNGVMIFSGCTVVDWNNTSGFGIDGKPPLVGLYTGYTEGNGKIQAKYLAYSNDRGRTWVNYGKNPIIDIQSQDFRDPKVFWHEKNSQWVMVLAKAKERRISFYSSPDLMNWEFMSDFGPVAETTGLWECPDLFELPVKGRPGESHWVLLVSIDRGAPAGGSGCQYFIGDFDGTQFVSQLANGEVPTKWLDYGRDFYATTTFSDIPESDGRRLAIAWMNNWQYAQDLPTSPWRGALTTIRELELVTGDEAGYRLIQKSINEYKHLRQGSVVIGDLELPEGSTSLQPYDIEGDCVEIELTLDMQSATRAGLIVAAGNQYQTVIGYDSLTNELYVDRSNASPDFHESYKSISKAPLRAKDGIVSINLFLDQSCLTVSGDDCWSTLSDRIFPGEDHGGISLWSEGGTARLASLRFWPLASAWTK